MNDTDVRDSIQNGFYFFCTNLIYNLAWFLIQKADKLYRIYLFIYLFTHLAKNNKIITKVRHYINKIL